MTVTPRAQRLVGVALAAVVCATCAGEGPEHRSEAGSGLAVGLLEPRNVASSEPGQVLDAAARPASGTVLAPVALLDQRTTGGGAGAGAAVVTLVPERAELCVALEVAGIDQPTAAHLHEAPRDGDGEVVLALKAPRSGDAAVDACVSAPVSVLERIRRAPDRFAIAVTTEAEPEGALRGQLR